MIKNLLQIGLLTIVGMCGLCQSQEKPSEVIPDELALAKSKFLKAQKALANELPTKLNGLYLQRVEALKKAEAAKGNEAAALLLEKEVESFKAKSVPDPDVDPEKLAEFKELREVYSKATFEFENQKMGRNEKLIAEYKSDLESIVTTLTKAGRIDDALVVRAELKQTASLALPGAKTVGAAKSLTGGRAKPTGKGQLRVVGRVSDDKGTSWSGGLIDGSVFDGFSDFVKVVGNEAGVIGLRENGEIVDMSGKIVASNAVDVIAAPWKYIGVDADGKTINVFRKAFTPENRRLLQYKTVYGRDLILVEGGDLFGANLHYDNGKWQQPPANARRDVKQIASEGSFDFALKNTGELVGWNSEGEITMPPVFRAGVKLMAPSRTRTWFLASDNKVYDSKGVPLDGGPDHAKYIAAGGDLLAVLGSNNIWTVTARSQTVGNEVELATAVLNHPATVSVRFYLEHGDKNDGRTTAYVAWIEDPTVTAVPFIEVDQGIDTRIIPTTSTTTSRPSTLSGSGSQFFGIPID